MLSTKVQNDLITAYQKVYEEKRGHAAGSDDTEKQASQLASDVRYKAKGKVPEGASEEEKRKIYLQILGASPAPNVVKAMAKEKLLGEEVVNEVLGVVTATPKVMTKAKQVRARKQLIQNVKTKAKEYGEKAGRALVGTTPKGRAVRIAAGGTAAYMMGRAGEADANINRSNTYRSLVKQDFKPESKIKPLRYGSYKQCWYVYIYGLTCFWRYNFSILKYVHTSLLPIDVGFLSNLLPVCIPIDPLTILL